MHDILFGNRYCLWDILIALPAGFCLGVAWAAWITRRRTP